MDEPEAQPRQVGGPIPWSGVLLPFYRKKIRQVYPVWCSRLHNHTLFIKKPHKKLAVPSKFWESGPPFPRPYQWLHPLISQLHWVTMKFSSSKNSSFWETVIFHAFHRAANSTKFWRKPPEFVTHLERVQFFYTAPDLTVLVCLMTI